LPRNHYFVGKPCSLHSSANKCNSTLKFNGGSVCRVLHQIGKLLRLQSFQQRFFTGPCLCDSQHNFRWNCLLRFPPNAPGPCGKALFSPFQRKQMQFNGSSVCRVLQQIGKLPRGIYRNTVTISSTVSSLGLILLHRPHD
jgi:hypothetical protein